VVARLTGRAELRGSVRASTERFVQPRFPRLATAAGRTDSEIVSERLAHLGPWRLGHDGGLLLAEEFVLLALNVDGTLARGVANQPAVAVGVTGALITELVQAGHLDLADGRVRVTGTRPAHLLLCQALDNLAPHEGKKLKNRLASVKHAGWNEVVDAMVAEGVVGRVKDGVRPTRHPVTDPNTHASLVAELRAVAIGDGPIAPREAGLLALAGPSHLLEVVAPQRPDRATARRRIAEASKQVPAAAAVKHVIESMAAVVVV